MTGGAAFPEISKGELLARLSAGHASRLTVVTPNQRLAAALTRDFDAHQLARGLLSWEAADILPVSAFVGRLYEDARYSELAAELPPVLSGAQERSIWEDIVGESTTGRGLLAPAGAARLAQEAWQILHAWRLTARFRDYPANDDARAFADWAWRYQGRAARERHCEFARVPDLVAAHLAHAALAKPATLVVYGFDIVDAQQREFFAALARAGAALAACGPVARTSQSRRVAYTSGEEEIRAAACWARARLEADPNARIGVVVPDLARSRNAVHRIFAQVMEPAYFLAGAPGRTPAPPFNISLGEPLAAYPIVSAAILVLDLARTMNADEFEFSRASRLIRSPFIGGAETELAARSILDAELRRVAGPKIGLERLRRAITSIGKDRRPRGAPDHGRACPVLAHHLAQLAAAANLRSARRPGEWARIVSALLDAVGFPGERSLDSAEHQALAKFHEAIAAFAALDRVSGRMRFGEACARLARMASDTLFQPEAPDVPIQVLGVLESAGLEFSHLWVMRLTEEAWPIPARPNPFIPVALQRAAGVPEASAAASLELDRRITRGWLASAGEVVFSHPLREDDRELVASPLILQIAAASPEELALPEYRTPGDAIRAARREERIPDFRAPALAAPGAVPGGTGVFRDQAACPFRAYAVHRLGAEDLQRPSPGLDARERGMLLHAMLAKLWQDLKSKARLDAAGDAELDALLSMSAEHAVAQLRLRRADAIDARFAALERERLVRLGRAWLAVERSRPAFVVAAIEAKHRVSFGGVAVNARLDRMDRIEGAGHAVIDYKSGSTSAGDWLGERPDEPQLPLYAVSSPEEISAVAFARVKAGDMRYQGIAAAAGLIPGVQTLEQQRSAAAQQLGSWSELLARWRAELDALGSGFAAGDARVDPKRGPQTCRDCGLQPLCRVSERGGTDEARDDVG